MVKNIESPTAVLKYLIIVVETTEVVSGVEEIDNISLRGQR
jgi:hypothetical protein